MAPRETELQQYQSAARDLLFDAREALDERSYRALVDFLIVLIAREAARCTEWEQRAA